MTKRTLVLLGGGRCCSFYECHCPMSQRGKGNSSSSRRRSSGKRKSPSSPDVPAPATAPVPEVKPSPTSDAVKHAAEEGVDVSLSWAQGIHAHRRHDHYPPSPSRNRQLDILWNQKRAINIKIQDPMKDPRVVPLGCNHVASSVWCWPSPPPSTRADSDSKKQQRHLSGAWFCLSATFPSFYDDFP